MLRTQTKAPICLVQRTFLVLAALLLLLSQASSQLDPATGYIKPTPGVPRFDPAAWNAAYTVTFRNLKWNKTSDKAEDTHPASDGCRSEGFDTTAAASVPLFVRGRGRGTGPLNCFYKNITSTAVGGTYDYWAKYQGLAFDEANCYCYALNHFEGGFCSPGTSNGGRARKAYSDMMTCPDLHQALIDDGAVQVTRQQALSSQPNKGHYVAAMARPDGSCVPKHCSDEDYHFVRKDSSGTWSYKFPEQPATDKDLEGRPITDPEGAPLPGHYVVCGYYQVDPMQMPTGTSPKTETPGPLADPSVMADVRRLRNTTGVTVDISLTPYNPETDSILDSAQQRLNEEDLEWERKRGTKEYKEWMIKQKQKVELSTDDGAHVACVGRYCDMGAKSRHCKGTGCWQLPQLS